MVVPWKLWLGTLPALHGGEPSTRSSRNWMLVASWKTKSPLAGALSVTTPTVASVAPAPVQAGVTVAVLVLTEVIRELTAPRFTTMLMSLGCQSGTPVGLTILPAGHVVPLMK